MPIENTQNRSAADHLVDALVLGVPGAIEQLEVQGQQQLIHSQVLPSEILRGTWEDVEALGITRGDPVDSDPLFVHATLPDGWSVRATEHPRWSEVVDPRGIARLQIFYKAAYYDRKAHIGLIPVGARLATQSVFRHPASLPEEWDLLTPGEQTEFSDELSDYIMMAEEDPDSYGDEGSRAQTLLSLIDLRNRS